jgi:predicted SAM-dependent methyltransferase
LALLKELHRTLKKGAWVRICVPGLMQTLAAFDLGIPKDDSTIDRGTFVSPAEALHDLAQNWGHLSLWDGDLFCAMLRHVGFEEAMTMSYQKGNDPQILQDSPSRRIGSLYVEARK